MPLTVQLAESQLLGSLTSPIDNSSATPTFTATFVDTDTNLARVPSASTNIFVIGRGTSSFEIFYGTTSTTLGVTTITVTARGLPKDGSATQLTAVTANYQAHYAGDEISVVDIATPLNILALKLNGTDAINSNITLSGTPAVTGTLTFPSTTLTGLVIQSVTTTQRLALTGVVNGAIVYDSTIGELWQYITGAWSAVAAGSTQPNASTSVAGKVQEATVAQVGAGTQTGSTGADLFINPTAVVTASAGAGSANYLVALNASGLVDSTMLPAPSIAMTGEIKIWSTAAAPTGWLLCNGSSLLRAGTYAALFAVIGTTYGSIDGSHFTLPDLRNNFVVGSGSTYALAATGGAATVTLDTTMIPSHTHTIAEGNGATAGFAQQSGGATGGSITSSATGGGLAHNNLPPYLALNYIIKT